MLPVVCRCCGSAMECGAPENPNICAACAVIDWSEEVLPTAESPAKATPPLLSELEHFLEVDGPTMVECFDATEQAKRAIAEAAASEAIARETSASKAP